MSAPARASASPGIGERRVAVVGGGIAGLTATRELYRRGVDVTLYEASDRVGGVLRSSQSDGFLREHAANAFLSAPDGAVALADELGVAIEEAAPAARKRWVYIDGRLKALPTNPLDFVASDLLTWRGKLSALAEPLRPARKQGDESVYEFARRRLGDEVARAIVAPFVTGVFAGSADKLSLEAGFPKLAELERRGGLVRGMISRMRETARERRRGTGGGTSPSPGKQRLSAPIGGAQALVEALAAELGDVPFRLGLAIDRISRAGEHLILHYPNGEEARYHAVVLATPAYRAGRMVGELAPEMARALDQIPYAPAVVLHLGFDRADIAHPLDGFGFLVAEGEDLRILGCVFESVLWPNRAPAGRVLLRCILGGARDPAAADLGDDELVALARRDLRTALGVSADPVHVNVVRWPRAIAQYTIGHGKRVARAETIAHPLGIVLAGSGYHGVAVNSCVADARRVADQVVAVLERAASMAVLLIAVTALVLASACGGGKPQTKRDDGGEVAEAAEVIDAAPADTPVGAAPPYRLAPVDGQGRVTGAGSAEVRVTWDDAPPALRRSPGLNACGAERRQAVEIHTLGGLAGAVVSLEDVASGRAPAEQQVLAIAIEDCQAGPRVAVAPRLGARLEIANHDERRHEVVVEQLADAAPEPLAGAALPLIGQRVAVALGAPGPVRITGPGFEPAYVFVPAHPYVTRTDATGVARLDQVPAGQYRVAVWYPPVRGDGSPIRLTGELEVKAGERARLTLAVPESPGAR